MDVARRRQKRKRAFIRLWRHRRWRHVTLFLSISLMATHFLYLCNPFPHFRRNFIIFPFTLFNPFYNVVLTFLSFIKMYFFFFLLSLNSLFLSLPVFSFFQSVMISLPSWFFFTFNNFQTPSFFFFSSPFRLLCQHISSSNMFSKLNKMAQEILWAFEILTLPGLEHRT